MRTSGCARRKVGQPRHQLLAREGHRRRDAHQPARHARQVAHAGKAVGDLLEGPAHVFHQPLARLGEPHAARGALHQWRAGRALELGDALAHGRLAHAQAQRRGREAALLRQHREPVQVRPQRLDILGFHACIVQQDEQ
jgi:hypothetical protein